VKRLKKARVALDALAHQLSDALGFVECAVTALQDAEQAWPALLVLQHAVKELRKVHHDLDFASSD
jgi:signal transduction histidine kinase